MPHSGSAVSTSSNVFCDARYQKECWYSIAVSNSFCASGLHDVSKCTFPSLLSSPWAKAGWVKAMTAAAATDILIMSDSQCGNLIDRGDFMRTSRNQLCNFCLGIQFTPDG